MDYKKAYKIWIIARSLNVFLMISRMASGLQLFSHNVRSHIPLNMYQFVWCNLAVCFWSPQLFSTKNRMWTQMLFFAEVYASQTILNSIPLSILGYFKKVTSPVACRGDGGWPNFIISAIFHNFGQFHNFSQISQSWNTWNTWNTWS